MHWGKVKEVGRSAGILWQMELERLGLGPIKQDLPLRLIQMKGYPMTVPPLSQ